MENFERLEAEKLLSLQSPGRNLVNEEEAGDDDWYGKDSPSPRIVGKNDNLPKV